VVTFGSELLAAAVAGLGGPVLLVDDATEVSDDEHAQFMARATPASRQ